LLASAQSLKNAIELLNSSAGGYRASLGLEPRERLSQIELQALARLAAALQNSKGHDITIAFDRDFVKCVEALESLGRSIKSYDETARALTTPYDVAAVRDLQPETLARQWWEADASLWPSSMLGKRKIRKL